MRPYFEHVLGELEGAKAKARDYRRLAGTTLHIGLMCTIGPARLIDLFAGFGEENPGVDIQLVDGPVPVIEEKLARGDLDLAIFCRPEALEDRFHTVPLFEERFLVAIAAGHPLARKNAISIRDLDQQYYLGRSTCEFYDHLRRIRLEIGGVEFRRRYSSDRDDWVQSMVKAGLGFTYIPEFAVAQPGLVVRPLVEPEVRRTVQLVTVRGRPHSPAVGAFVRAARRFAWPGKTRPPATPELASGPA
jgi:DNA-binding transcriptional LysR family regulator